MAVNTKAIKERLRSVKSSGKVTKAMQLIAAAKMRKAVTRAVESRTYAREALTLARYLAMQATLKGDDSLRRFLASTPTEGRKEKQLLVVIAGNRGLCGAFNSNIGKAALKFLDFHGRENVETVALGKKALGYLSARGVIINRFYLKDDDPKSADPILALAEHLHYRLREGRVDRVWLLFTHFRSALFQEPQLLQLFPIAFDEAVGRAYGATLDRETPLAQEERRATELRFEPDARTILAGLTLAIGESVLYQALLESNASEHSARMVAMRSATKAAGEMYDELTLIFNKARQAAITQELAEISAGRAALG